MGCGCSDPGMVRSWNDIAKLSPTNPLDLIAYATLNGTVGAYANSTTYAQTTGVTWVNSGVIVSAEASVLSLATDQMVTQAYANQWNFQHLTDNLVVPPPLRKVLFLKAGTAWQNIIPLNFGGASTFDEVELSFRDNAGTRGDSAGTIPVITFGGSYTGVSVLLNVTLQRTGIAIIGLKMRNTVGSDLSMFEMEWHIVE